MTTVDRYSRMPTMYRHPKQGRPKNADDTLVDLIVRIVQPTIALAGAACVGHADIFDLDATPEQHAQAAQICAECPVATRCSEWAAAQHKNVSGVLGGSLRKGPYFKYRKAQR